MAYNNISPEDHPLLHLRQEGQPLERYEAEFVGWCYWVCWSDSSLNLMFLNGLDGDLLAFIMLLDAEEYLLEDFLNQVLQNSALGRLMGMRVMVVQCHSLAHPMPEPHSSTPGTVRNGVHPAACFLSRRPDSHPCRRHTALLCLHPDVLLCRRLGVEAIWSSAWTSSYYWSLTPCSASKLPQTPLQCYL